MDSVNFQKTVKFAKNGKTSLENLQAMRKQLMLFFISEKLQLKPKKSSQSLRQGLKVSTNKSGKCTSKTGSQAPGVPGNEEKSIPPEIVHVRQNMKCAATVRQFLMALKLAENLKSIIQFLTGRELTKILKSLGLPSFFGKSKTKQVDALFGYLTAVDAVDLKHPEKV